MIGVEVEAGGEARKAWHATWLRRLRLALLLLVVAVTMRFVFQKTNEVVNKRKRR